MDLDLPAEAEAFRRATREVVDDLLQYEPEYHRTDTVPEVVQETLRKMGYYGMTIPEAYGGLETDKLAAAAVHVELSRLPPQFWPLIRSAVGPVTHALVNHGTQAQKRANLPHMANGTRKISFAVTEPDCGSDVLAMRTTAVKKGSVYMLNGTKTFISNANKADVILVFAYTDRSKGREGITALLVDARTPGLTLSPAMPTTGWMEDGLFELNFNNCEIPADALVGEEGRGFFYALEGLNEARLNVGCQAVGCGDIALDTTLEYAKQRKTFGAALASHQAVQHMLADMAMDQHGARQVLFEAVWRLSRGEDVRLRSSMVKVMCTEAAGRTADRAVQLHGGSGYCRGTVVERVYRDVRVLRIFEGASEIHRNMIAKHLLR
ncbi:acyl-CoA dehydrogenase family protein [Variovorax sp. J22P168]|uniref:acyl-CoA dehydrogenase family protein n=1 Tax=Variovorax jilinensis TaxID=3053513 RepID=UPI002575A6E7|nr:acyl-CoA dehydrogenase family protein [Variovorax sp. J22P168]MDM0015169.1 acyl-CoA dehydrogenase family protein [Variovorax sp. J22P168]